MTLLKSKIICITTIGILTIGLTSCTTTRVASLTQLPNERIELYTTSLPEKQYTEISYIQTDGSIFNTPRQLLKGLKKKGISLEADAIINIKYDFQGWWPIASGTAIKYKN